MFVLAMKSLSWRKVTSDYTRDDDVVELRVLSGLSYRFHMGEAQAATPPR